MILQAVHNMADLMARLADMGCPCPSAFAHSFEKDLRAGYGVVYWTNQEMEPIMFISRTVQQQLDADARQFVENRQRKARFAKKGKSTAQERVSAVKSREIGAWEVDQRNRVWH